MASVYPKAAALIKERPLFHALKKAHYFLSGYNQLGLYKHDLIREDPNVKEALKRLPVAVKDAREARLHRFIDLDNAKNILPISEWTSYEDNLENGFYLADVLAEVAREQKEKDYWLAQ